MQAVLAVNDLFYLSTPTIESLFLEDVTAWLDEKEIRYSPNLKFTGKSGYDHSFDFVIPKSKQHPERIIKAINKPSKDTAHQILFSWLDTKDTRPKDSKLYAILNDTPQEISHSIISAISNYDVNSVRWSQRESAVELLAA